MTIQLFVSPIRASIGGGVTKTMLLRVALTIAAFSMAIVPVFAGENPVLRGDIAARSDVLALGDLVEGLAGPAATHPCFAHPRSALRARSRRSASPMPHPHSG